MVVQPRPSAPIIHSLPPSRAEPVRPNLFGGNQARTTVEESERKELIQFYHDAFASALDSAAYDDVPEIWNELAKLEPENTPAFLAMAGELEGRRKRDLAGELLVSLAALYKEPRLRDARETVLKQASKLVPRNEQLKELLADHYRELHGDHPMVEEAIRKSGLMRPMGVDETLPRLETSLKFRVGDIVHHTTGWGMGRVTSIDLDESTMTVDFEGRKNHPMSLEMGGKVLERLAPGSFRALKFTSPDTLRQMAGKDPEGLLKLVLKDLGGKATLKEVKARLTDGIVAADDWTRWWTAAKRAAMKDPYLGVSGGASAVMMLRDKPLTHQEEIITKLRGTRIIDKRIFLVDEYLKNLKSSDATADVLQQIAQILLEEANSEKDPAAFVLTTLVLDDLAAYASGSGVPRPSLDSIFTPATAMDIVNGISQGPYKRRALLKLRDLYPEEWPGVFTSVFFKAGSELWDFAAKELLDTKKHKEISQAFAQILSKSREYPEVYLWLCRAAVVGKYHTVLSEHNKIDLIEKLLKQTHELARPVLNETKTAEAERKKLVTKGRDAISASDFKPFQEIIANSSEDEARRVFNAATGCKALTDAAYEKIIDIIIAEYPRLRPAPAKTDAAPEDVIFTSHQGLRRKEAEFDNVINNEIPENQEALRVAISFGDLSENAEYTAAREQQGILMKKAERIKKELGQARVIKPETIDTAAVSIGTAVEVRNTRRNRIENYTILGPWDSDAENGVVSYLTPVALAFLGKKPGEKAVLDFSDSKEEYDIISISKALPRADGSL